jgi:hypothetical protein
LCFGFNFGFALGLGFEPVEARLSLGPPDACDGVQEICGPVQAARP